MSAPDVAFVGGGVIGLASAWRAALAGLSAVVVDPNPGGGASSAAAGMLAPVTEVCPGEEELLQLNLLSAERYPSFVGELEEAAGRSAGYRRCGTIAVARDADDRVALDELYRFHQQLGLSVERMGRAEVRALEPALAPNVRGGLFVPGDHQVDNRALVGALLAACARSGVELVRTRVRSFATAEGSARGVVLDDGSLLAAGAVVLCAGCWSSSIAGVPRSVLPPVRPVKGQLLHLRTPDRHPQLERTVRGSALYVVPRSDGRVVVGATVEEQGFDVTITAGAVLELLRGAYELIPGITELELVEMAVGLRPGSPDNAPIVGPTAVEGLIVATGHYRSGILLTPVTADAIADVLATGRMPEPLRPFSPARFAGSEALAG